MKKNIFLQEWLVTVVILFFSFGILNGQKITLPERLILLDSGFVFSNAPFQSCHASSIVSLPGNKIMAVWFGGKNEGNPDVSIWASINENGVWDSPKEIANGIENDTIRYACWNPVLFKSRNGLLFLHYKVGLSPSEWRAEMKTSSDNGVTWSTAKKLPIDFLGPIKNKPIQLKNGDILYPSSTESMNDKWTIHLERSDSKGNNWKKIDIDCDTFDVIQPSLLTYANGSMQLICRSRQNVIVESWSFDKGKTWQRVKATSLSNPNSGIDAVSLNDGTQLLVYNPLPHGNERWGRRSVLRIAVSIDGKQWKDVFTLEDHKQGEYSYPAVIQSNDGIIQITYTYNRKKIKYVRLNL